jgi:hypothetical protein
MVRRLIGVAVVGLFALAGALGSACSSSSGGSAPEAEAGPGPDTAGGPSPDASPWCYVDNTGNPNMIEDECEKNPGDCPIGTSGVSTCPTANLAGCCKGTANSPGGTDNEVCIYNDDYLANTDSGVGAKAWCTCMPATSGCFNGTWQTSP